MMAPFGCGRMLNTGISREGKYEGSPLTREHCKTTA
jgi:hypothetical protein